MQSRIHSSGIVLHGYIRVIPVESKCAPTWAIKFCFMIDFTPVEKHNHSSILPMQGTRQSIRRIPRELNYSACWNTSSVPLYLKLETSHTHWLWLQVKAGMYDWSKFVSLVKDTNSYIPLPITKRLQENHIIPDHTWGCWSAIASLKDYSFHLLVMSQPFLLWIMPSWTVTSKQGGWTIH
jgi:hypothetical protein